MNKKEREAFEKFKVEFEYYVENGSPEFRDFLLHYGAKELWKRNKENLRLK